MISTIPFRILILVLLFATAGCGSDNSTSPRVLGTVSGTITFVGSVQPDGDAVVSIWVSWPPTGNPAATTPPLKLGTTRQDYQFDGLVLGTYAAVTVDWSVEGDPSRDRVLGVYWANPDSVGSDGSRNLPVTPAPIILTADKPVAENIDFTADFDLSQ